MRRIIILAAVLAASPALAAHAGALAESKCESTRIILDKSRPTANWELVGKARPADQRDRARDGKTVGSVVSATVKDNGREFAQACLELLKNDGLWVKKRGGARR